MTTRNLNRTWLDVITLQYQQDYSDQVEYPVRYLLFNPSHNVDLFYLIPKPIEPAVFKKSLIDFHIYTRAHGYQEFDDGNIKVWKRAQAQPFSETRTDPATELDSQLESDLAEEPNHLTSPVKRRLQHFEQTLASRGANAPAQP